MPARVYARAHYHEWVRETVRVRQHGRDVVSDLVITPSSSGIDDYVRRATRSKRVIDHGLVVLVFEGGLREDVVVSWLTWPLAQLLRLFKPGLRYWIMGKILPLFTKTPNREMAPTVEEYGRAAAGTLFRELSRLGVFE